MLIFIGLQSRAPIGMKNSVGKYYALNWHLKIDMLRSLNNNFNKISIEFHNFRKFDMLKIHYWLLFLLNRI